MYSSHFVRHALAACVTSLAFAGTAQAGIVNYDFNGNDNNNLGPTEDFGPAGYVVTASAYRSLAGDPWTAANVSRAANALGVNSGLGTNPGQVDTNGAAVEGLLFDFGNLHFVSLTIRLGAYRNTGGNPENINVWTGDSFDASNAADPLDNHLIQGGSPGNPFTINFATRYLFISAADDGIANVFNCGGQASNCFRVDNISAVPEPGTLALVGLGLIGAARLRRRS